MKKRIFALTMAMVITLSVMLCGCSSAKTEKPLLDTIKERGTIIVATEGCWAPWTYHNEADELVGFDVEVAKAVAAKLGVTAEFVEVDFDGILAGIDARRYDITANGIEITEERSAKYNFCEPYAYIRTALIVREDEARINRFEDLKGMTTANTLKSTYAELGESYGATVTGVDDLIQTLELLMAGRVDATLNADVSYYDYLSQHPDAPLKVADLSKDASPVVIPVRKAEDTATLQTAISKAIEELRAEGKLAELSIKYFGSDITSK